METSDRLKIYQGFAELGRKWSQVMDTKAGFLSALNVAIISFIWIWAKLGSASGCVHILAMIATALAILSLCISLWVVLPRTTLKHALGKDLKYSSGYKAISFYGYVATTYPHDKHKEFMSDVNAIDEEGFIQEALEQHYTISHVVQKKSNRVVWAGYLWLIAVIVVTAAMYMKG